MPLFKYKALDQRGATTEGTETANSSGELVVRLRERQYYPVAVEEVIQKDIKDLNIFNKVGLKQLSLFTRQFSSMLRSGITIVNTLDILRQQTEHKRLRETIAKVYENVQKGFSFSEALERHPDVFPTLMVNMVAAGEASGNLDGVTQRMAVHYEKEFKVNNRVKSAMVYPIILAVLVVGVVAFMLAFVMPTFMGMFEGSGVPLPGVTRLLMRITAFLRGYWYVLAIGLVAMVFGVRRFASTPDGRRYVDKMWLRMPLFRGLNQKANSTRFCRTLSTLLASGIPLLQAMDNVAGAVGNVIVAEAVMQAKEDVRKGVALSVPIRRCGLFPPHGRQHDQNRRRIGRPGRPARKNRRLLRRRSRNRSPAPAHLHGTRTNRPDGLHCRLHRHRHDAAHVRYVANDTIASESDAREVSFQPVECSSTRSALEDGGGAPGSWQKRIATLTCSGRRSGGCRRCISSLNDMNFTATVSPAMNGFSELT
jgi:type IV pilus assembly protein PilC